MARLVRIALCFTILATVWLPGRPPTALTQPAGQSGWRPLVHDGPPALGPAVVVWTGQEVLVLASTGAGRYDPRTNRWRSMSLVGAPRIAYTQDNAAAIWTGRELIVWSTTWNAGQRRFEVQSGRYDPVLDRWRPMTLENAPMDRVRSIRVWTGKYLLVIGGFRPITPDTSEEVFAEGVARYDPTTDRWEKLADPAGTPPRARYAGWIWTGLHILVWGGYENPASPAGQPSNASSGEVNTGALYNPILNTWREIATLGAPSPRAQPHVVWSRGEMIVWGGREAQFGGGNARWLTDGARYDPQANVWRQMADASALNLDHNLLSASIGVGSSAGFAVLSSTLQSGVMYDSTKDEWRRVSPAPDFDGLVTPAGLTVIDSGWFAWKSSGIRKPPLAKAAVYDVTTNTWNYASGESGPSYVGVRAIWTGQEALVWGGGRPSGYPPGPGVGWAYDPRVDRWRSISTESAARTRDDHRMVWTGKEMIVLGGCCDIGIDGSSRRGSWRDGAKYNPATDSWSPMQMLPRSVDLAPVTSAVWAGSEMHLIAVVSGSGADPYAVLSYDPESNNWRTTPTPGMTVERLPITVWTGDELLIWLGAEPGTSVAGVAYRPSTNSFRPMSSFGGPSYRRASVVWTGQEMIVWGGGGLPKYDTSNLGQSPIPCSINTFDDGYAYDPRSDRWRQVSSVLAPSPRMDHVAVWTGQEMLVWGGADENGLVEGGGRYDPVADLWTPIESSINIVSPRRRAESVWTGEEWLIFSGDTGRACDWIFGYDLVLDAARYRPPTKP